MEASGGHQVLYNSRNPDYFTSSLIIDTSGNLYGTTLSSGKFFDGSAYELVRPQTGAKWKLKVL